MKTHEKKSSLALRNMLMADAIISLSSDCFSAWYDNILQPTDNNTRKQLSGVSVCMYTFSRQKMTKIVFGDSDYKTSCYLHTKRMKSSNLQWLYIKMDTWQPVRKHLDCPVVIGCGICAKPHVSGWDVDQTEKQKVP